MRESLIGMVEGMSDAGRKEWIARMRDLGRKGK